MKSIRILSLSRLVAVVVVVLGIICFAPIVLTEDTDTATLGTEDCGQQQQQQGECRNPDTATTVESVQNDKDPNCPSRESIIRCAGMHLDTNKNGKLDRIELESAIASLPWYARGLLQILGSVDKMVRL
jgi:hypothetical protein